MSYVRTKAEVEVPAHMETAKKLKRVASLICPHMTALRHTFSIQLKLLTPPDRAMKSYYDASPCTLAFILAFHLMFALSRLPK